MSDAGERFRRVAARFDEVAVGVADWDVPAPCAGWVARDVVRHLVEWVPGMFGSMGVAAPSVSVDDDPVAAWRALRDGLQAVLDDPASSERTMRFGPAGEHTVPDAVDRFVTPDVLVHTWDVARATGQDEALDPEVCEATLVGFQAMGEMLVQSGHFGAAVPIVDDAPLHLRLVAASGRDPAWRSD
jgi:uncharacterized protein (TIGR03086 family)